MDYSSSNLISWQVFNSYFVFFFELICLCFFLRLTTFSFYFKMVKQAWNMLLAIIIKTRSVSRDSASLSWCCSIILHPPSPFESFKNCNVFLLKGYYVGLRYSLPPVNQPFLSNRIFSDIIPFAWCKVTEGLVGQFWGNFSINRIKTKSSRWWLVIRAPIF